MDKYIEKHGHDGTCAHCEEKLHSAEDSGENREQRLHLARIIIAAAALVVGMLPVTPPIPAMVLLYGAYAMAGLDILWRALRNILRGEVFDENFLMAVATVGALALGETAEGAAVMLFYQLGEWFQDMAVGRSRRSIATLMDIRPDFANRRGADGTLETVDPQQVAVGEVIVVKPGERIPLDGVIAAGQSVLDTSALTGESLPKDVEAGDEVSSGCVNLGGLLEITVSRPYGESTVARILELVENASEKKAQSERFITRFSRWYTPIVCAAALLLAVAPPLVLGQAFGPWIYRALTFLVISCPCALVISVPLSFFGGIGGASKKGILVKGGNTLEALAKTDTVVFDKTGTLTEGRFSVAEVRPVDMSEAELLELAALAETYSNHPIAQSIRRAFGVPVDPARLGDVKELPGLGISAEVDGRRVLAGNAALIRQANAGPSEVEETGTVVYLAVDGVYAGYVRVADRPKHDARRAVENLKKLGVERVVMLTGDAEGPGRQAAAQVGISDVHTGLLPTGKVEKVEQLLEAPGRKGTLAFVGDGVNDAPVLARADVGVAMGGLGSDAAIEAADVVIMTDEPSRLATAIGISRKTLRIVAQNIVFALGIKAVVLVLGALGFTSMWAAVFADVGVSALAVLNAMRAMRYKSV